MPLPFPENTRLEWLRAEIRRHNDLYYNDAAPEISDDQYDKLFGEGYLDRVMAALQ